MAPKKPPDKQEKGEPPKDKAAKAPGELTPWQEKVKKFFESSYSLYVGAVLVMGSIVGAIMLTYLYVKEVQRRAIFEEGTTKILQMVEDTFPDLFEADDITKFKKAENISAAISEEKKKISELQQAISDIHHRLHEEWIVWHGALYIFDFIATPRTWKQCIQYCERMKYDTKLLCVESDEEEAFAVAIVKPRPTDYFIGINMVGSDWRCYQKGFRLDKLYWDSYRPRNKGPAKPDSNNCVIISRGCGNIYECWHDALCHGLKRCICKRKPIRKWMK